MGKQALVRTLASVLLVILAVGAQIRGTTYLAGKPMRDTTVVLAESSDPYWPLAQEIAQQEKLALVQSLDEAAKLQPAYLLWVLSPTQLSDRVLIGFSLARLRHDIPAAVGIISGSTIDQARALWQRAKRVQSVPVIIANGEFPSAGIMAARLTRPKGQPALQPMTKDTLVAALQEAGYLSFTGHGGRRTLALDPETELVAADLPSLPPVVVSTASCNTFRVWEEQSIALAFTDRGAAAYAGFAYSPNEGYLIGEFSGLPLRYSWPGFTIGQVIQVQSRGTLQGFARFPYYYLLGDPRIALQATAPYQLTSDEVRGNERILTFSNLPAGIVPMRIPGGASYRFAEVPGFAAAWDRDPFYNARLQMGNMGSDKYVLVEQKGGDLTLRLRRTPPWYWAPLDILGEGLDHTLLFAGIPWPLGVIALLPALWLLLRKRAPWRLLLPAALAGLVCAGLYALYAVLRLPQISINSKPVPFSPGSLAGLSLAVVGGAVVYLNARRNRGRELGLWLAGLPAVAAVVFTTVVMAVVNLLMSGKGTGTSVYNYALGALSLVGLVVEMAVFQGLFALLGRMNIAKRGGQ